MKYREDLSLVSDERIDVNLLLELEILLTKRGVELHSIDVEAYSFEKCKELLLEKGASYVLSSERLQEAVLRKVETKHKYLLVQILREKLKALSPSDSLIIVDPYFFPTTLDDRPDFLQTLQDILVVIVGNIKQINFVTKHSYNQSLFEEANKLLLGMNPQLTILRKFTDDFHDRIWIADEQRGLFVGTSLNGIGKKYALTDNVSNDDTRTIIDELRRLNLLG